MSAKFSKQNLQEAVTNEESKRVFSYSQLLKLGLSFLEASNHTIDEIKKFESKIKDIPLLAILSIWTEDSILAGTGRTVDVLMELIKKKTIGKTGKLLTLEEFAKEDHDSVIDAIRINKEWTIWEREEYVHHYISFENWLSVKTFGFIPKAVDYDRLISEKRKLSFNKYYRILNELQDRERILAKIFYLGGSRSLEEVLSLKIEDVDYFKKAIKLSGEFVSYPRHVLVDILDYIGDRKKGFVFTGKGGERINHTVPYRALKTVISKLKLDPSFTFKEFVKNL